MKEEERKRIRMESPEGRKEGTKTEGMEVEEWMLKQGYLV